MSEEISLSFVNGGKKFVIPHMTVRRQEDILKIMADIEKKKLSEDEKNNEINKQLVYKMLKEVDNSVTMDNILDLHPDDYIFLFTTIMESGREIKSDKGKDFRKTK